MYKCNVDRMEDKIKTFSQFGDAGHGGITRYSLSKEAEMARDEFVKRMTAIGAEIETDDLANIYATIPGSDPNAKRIVMGYHCDSVKIGGNYDGILGINIKHFLNCISNRGLFWKMPAKILVLLPAYWGR